MKIAKKVNYKKFNRKLNLSNVLPSHNIKIDVAAAMISEEINGGLKIISKKPFPEPHK